MRIERNTVDAADISAIYVDEEIFREFVTAVDADAGYVEFRPKDERGNYKHDGTYFLTQRRHGEIRIER